MALVIVFVAFVVVGVAAWLFGTDNRPAACDPPQQEWPFLPRRQ
jgi:hypothetical protein